jgi:hypothetical protein
VARLFKMIALIAALVSLAGLAAAPASAGRADGPRYEELLYWDDGSAELTCPPSYPSWPYDRLAVRFQAPAWARSVVAMRIWVGNDGVANPDDPDLPSTLPVRFLVWQVGEDSRPGAPANGGYTPFTDMGEYPEMAWIEARFPTPIDITNPVHFPDGWFFVGIEWLHHRNPILGVDGDDPAHGHSIQGDGSDWEWLSSDALIRAIVSSEWSGVDSSTWTHIKAVFQE